jgi:hypothetical protein
MAVHNAVSEAAVPPIGGCAPGLPSFLIVGPPRTGTTWLHEVLSRRTNLPSPTKETRFFDVHFHRGLKWYRDHFPPAIPDLPVGEVAPTYFASKHARERVARIIPEAKVVCIFRNPVERVLSLYRLKRAYAMIPWSFDQAMDRDPELLESGRYAMNLRAWQRALGAERVLASVYDDLRDGPQSYIESLADFIQIPRFSLTQSEARHVNGSDTMTHPRSYIRTRSARAVAEWFKARRFDSLVAAARKSPLQKVFLSGGRAFAELSLDMSVRLYELFRPEVEELEAMLNRDLSTWKSPIPVKSPILATE